ncbi:MAG TPA: hypothetical protein VNV86_13510 [Candidatus Acidoferrum sp.]|jgi:hypothetical protein|nr:hypothetical protein [Candidatus Acidoferrum sp.]
MAVTRSKAMSDADVARGFYRRIAGFNEADRHVRELEDIHAPVARTVVKRRPSRWR